MARELTVELQPDETVILSGFANRIGFWGGPGGRLVLTNKRLLFTNGRGRKSATPTAFLTLSSYRWLAA